MANKVTIVFSANDLDLSAISFTYKGEEIYLPFTSASSTNQVLSAADDEIPEMIRIRATVTSGGTRGTSTPVQKPTTPIFHTPLTVLAGLATPTTVTPTHKRPAYDLRSPLSDWDHRTCTGTATSARQHVSSASTTTSINLKTTTPAAPSRPLADEKITPAIPSYSEPTCGHQTNPIVIEDEPVAIISKKNVKVKARSVNFKIDPTIWTAEIQESNKQTKTFKSSSFQKCVDESRTVKDRRVVLKKIYKQIGEQEFWDCVPMECHDKPRPVPEECGKPFLEHVLRCIVRTKDEAV